MKVSVLLNTGLVNIAKCILAFLISCKYLRDNTNFTEKDRGKTQVTSTFYWMNEWINKKAISCLNLLIPFQIDKYIYIYIYIYILLTCKRSIHLLIECRCKQSFSTKVLINLSWSMILRLFTYFNIDRVYINSLG